MFIKKLPRNERAPATVDRVCMYRLDDGTMTWSGSIKVGSATPVGARGATFETIQEAETDAIQWARGHGTPRLLIDVSNA